MLNLFTLLVFLLILVAFYTARSLSSRQRRADAVTARLAALRQSVGSELALPDAVLGGTDSITLEQDASGVRWPWLAAHLTRIRADLKALGWRENLRQRLLLSGVAALVGGLVLTRMSGLPLLLALPAALLLWAAICAYAYQSAMSKYLEQLARTLPEAIDAITRICRAGVPLHGAFTVAADHLRGALVGELREIDHWLKLGVPLRQVMQASAQRVPLPEYRFFAVILIISQESGGRLGDTLERLAITLRERAELGMKVQAKTSEARASAKIVALLVPGVLLYMYLNAPADFRFMFNDPTGIRVLLYVAASVSLGLLITRYMVRRVR